MKYTTLLIFCVWWPLLGYGQEPFMHHITDDDGLPSLEVFNIIQDDKGYYWLGTDNGLCRFDGIRFKVYSHPKQRGRAFSRFKIDTKNRIWMVNFSGQIFYVEQDTLKLFEPFEKLYISGYPRFDVDNNDRLWISSIGNPLMYYDLNKHIWVEYPAFNSSYVLNLIVNKNFEMVFTNNKIQHIHKPEKFKQKQWQGIQYSPQTNFAYAMKGIDGQLNGFTLDKIDSKFNITPIGTDILPNKLARVNDFISFSDDDCWLLTYDGVFHVGIQNNKLYLKGYYLKNMAISWVIKDRENNYWISTLKNGLFMIPSMHVWLMNKQNSELKDNRITRIERGDSPYLYIGTGEGLLIKFNTQTKKIELTTAVDQDKKDIDAILYDPIRKNVYVQTTRLNRLNDQFKIIPPYQLNFSAIKDLSINKNGLIAIGNSFSGHLLAFDKEVCSDKPASDFAFAYSQKVWVASLYEQRSYTIHLHTKNESIWQGAVDGLYCFHNGKRQRIKDPQSGSDIYVNDIIESSDGSIWLATMQQGIYKIEGQKVVLHLNTEKGLLSDFTKCLTYDESKNQLWFATNNGIQSYEVATGKIKSFKRANGLISNDILDMEIMSPYLFIGSPKGLEWVNTDSLSPNLFKPSIYLTGIQLNDVDTVITNQYILPHDINSIRISYSGIANKARKNIRYAYRLIGLDSNWTVTNYENDFAVFNSLPPGIFVFQVKSINEDNVESDAVASITFDIKIPYWQTWWFYMLSFIIVMLLASAAFMIRINILTKRNRLERKNVELELEKSNIEKELRTSQLSALKVQMNPHFIFNALNSIQEYILTNEKKLANAYLGKFSDLMRLYLDMSNKQLVTLDEEIRALGLYLELEAMRFEDNFSYQLHIEERMQTDEYLIPPMVIQPFVENAIKHGLLHKRSNKRLSIFFKWDAMQNLVCEVIDNGIGRKQSAELNSKRRKDHKSFATGAIQRRLEILNQGLQKPIGVVYEDLVDAYGNAEGTKVTISL